MYYYRANQFNQNGQISIGNILYIIYGNHIDNKSYIVHQIEAGWSKNEFKNCCCCWFEGLEFYVI